MIKMAASDDSTGFSEEHLRTVREFFLNLTGNRLGADKRALIESRLRKRLIATGLRQDEYFELLERSDKERSEFITALTTHKTDWFREKVHLDFVAGQAANTTSSDAVTVWSAACSTGEEPYSLAMALDTAGVGDFRILGSDISRECVQRATAGIYKQDQVDSQVPDAIKRRFFLRGKAPGNAGLYRVKEEYRRKTKFIEFNLVNSSLKADVRFDFILLRNVLIYFDQESGHEIVKRLCAYLKPGGYLILGLSEAVTKPEKLGLEKMGNSIFTLCR